MMNNLNMFDKSYNRWAFYHLLLRSKSRLLKTTILVIANKNHYLLLCSITHMLIGTPSKNHTDTTSGQQKHTHSTKLKLKVNQNFNSILFSSS